MATDDPARPLRRPSTGRGIEGHPPVAARRPVTRSHHGIEVVDHYEWLRDRDSPDVRDYIDAENSWTERNTANLGGLAESLFADFRCRGHEGDLVVPALVTHVEGGSPCSYWYYTRFAAGLPYRMHCRVPVSAGVEGGPAPDVDRLAAGGDEQVLLDENREAAGHPYFDLGQIEVSPSGRLVAYLVDTTGGEVFDLRVVDVDSRRIVAELHQVHYGVAWLGDDDLFYTLPDPAWRSWQIRHFHLPTHTDTEVFTEHDAHFDVGPIRSRDGTAVLLCSRSRTSAEWWMVTAADDPTVPTVVAPRRPGVDYVVEHAGDRLLILHNDGAEDFALAQAPLTARSSTEWAPVLAHRPGVRLTAVDAYERHVVVSLRRDGLAGIDVIARDEHGDLAAATPIDPGRELYTMRHEPGANVSDRMVRYRISSLVDPPTVVEQDPDTGQSRVLRTAVVPAHPDFGPFRSSDYVQHRVWASAPDGARVPISVVHRRDALDRGPAPTLITGYGAYEACMEPVFDSDRLALLDRGVVFAMAHVRGGGELGREWYEQGRMLAKRNTFTDFVACARHLVDEGWTSPGLLAARGGSAGGLLMGAVANLAPALFRAIHADVAFVDPLTTCLDPGLPGIVNEWEEWGDPAHDEEIYRYMSSYAPYDNVAATDYPAILATTGLNDVRVHYVEPAKWIARLRHLAPYRPDRPILLRTDLVSGHHGPSGRDGTWRRSAFTTAWLLDQIGIGDSAS